MKIDLLPVSHAKVMLIMLTVLVFQANACSVVNNDPSQTEAQLIEDTIRENYYEIWHGDVSEAWKLEDAEIRGCNKSDYVQAFMNLRDIRKNLGLTFPVVEFVQIVAIDGDKATARVGTTNDTVGAAVELVKIKGDWLIHGEGCTKVER